MNVPADHIDNSKKIAEIIVNAKADAVEEALFDELMNGLNGIAKRQQAIIDKYRERAKREIMALFNL